MESLTCAFQPILSAPTKSKRQGALRASRRGLLSRLLNLMQTETAITRNKVRRNSKKNDISASSQTKYGRKRTLVKNAAYGFLEETGDATMPTETAITRNKVRRNSKKNDISASSQTKYGRKRTLVKNAAYGFLEETGDATFGSNRWRSLSRVYALPQRNFAKSES